MQANTLTRIKFHSHSGSKNRTPAKFSNTFNKILASINNFYYRESTKSAESEESVPMKKRKATI